MNFRLNYTTHEFLIQIHLNRQPTASLNPLAPTPLTPNRLHMSVHHYTYLTHCLPKAVLTHSVNSILVLVNFTIEHKTNSFGLWKLDFHFDSHSWYSGANLVVTLFPSSLHSIAWSMSMLDGFTDKARLKIVLCCGVCIWANGKWNVNDKWVEQVNHSNRAKSYHQKCICISIGLP